MTFPLAQLLSPVLTSLIPPPYNPLTDIPNLLFLNSYKTITPTGAVVANSGTHGPFPGRRISGTPPAMTVNIASAGLSSVYAGGSAVFAGYVNAGNNGAFSLSNAGLSSVSWNNAAGVAEPTVAGADTVASATVAILGLASSYADLVAGYAFSQATTADKFAVNDTLISGTKTLGVEADLTRHLGCISIPLASQLNGTVALTAFQYFRPTGLGISGATTQWMRFTDAAGTNRIGVAHGNATNGSVTTSSAAGATTQSGVLSTAMALNAWQLLAVTHTGTTATWFLNGVQVATTTAGTLRTRANLDRVYVGGLPSTSAGTSGHRAVDGAVARVMTPAELLNLTAWCQAEYA